mmetsp:Transcript_3102/g.6921  ORF Transcript_3102/g.6921 Transcript_3102/m.6921 type:complete len:191 (+) Transcript_3102:54-626(+)
MHLANSTNGWSGQVTSILFFASEWREVDTVSLSVKGNLLLSFLLSFPFLPPCAQFISPPASDGRSCYTAYLKRDDEPPKSAGRGMISEVGSRESLASHHHGKTPPMATSSKSEHERTSSPDVSMLLTPLLTDLFVEAESTAGRTVLRDDDDEHPSLRRHQLHRIGLAGIRVFHQSCQMSNDDYKATCPQC